MPDEFQFVNSGDRWQESAAFRNAVTEAVRAHQASRKNFGGDVNPTDLTKPPVRILNVSGDGLDQFAIVGIGEPIVTPAQNPDEFRLWVGFESAAPAAGASFAILTEPVPEDAIARAMASGVTQCKINRTSTAHNFAGPADSDYVSLASTAAGPARIFWVSDLPAAAYEPDITITESVGIPDDGDGANGDYYSDTANEKWYLKAAGTWGASHAYGTGLVWAIVLLDQVATGTPGGGNSQHFWSKCKIAGTAVTVARNDHMPVATRIAAGQFLVVMSLSFGHKDNYSISWSLDTDDTFKFPYASRTPTSFLAVTASGTDPSESFDFQVHGTPGAPIDPDPEDPLNPVDPTTPTVLTECCVEELPNALCAQIGAISLGIDDPVSDSGQLLRDYAEGFQLELNLTSYVEGSHAIWTGSKRLPAPGYSTDFFFTLILTCDGDGIRCQYRINHNYYPTLNSRGFFEIVNDLTCDPFLYEGTTDVTQQDGDGGWTDTTTVTFPITITTAPCGATPSVTQNLTTICDDAATITIAGSGFDTTAANNIITLSSGTATCTVATSTSLTATLDTPPSLGALTAIIVNDSGTSAPAVQVGLVLTSDAPTITPDSSSYSAGPLVFTGTGFDSTMTVTLSSGTYTYVVNSTTQVTVTFSVAPDLGSLTATVETECGGMSTTEEIAIIGTPGSGAWFDTFTDADDTALTSHTPEIGTGGYTAIAGTMKISSNRLIAATQGSDPVAANVALASFDPATIVSPFTFKFSLDTGGFVQAMFRYSFASNNGFIVHVDASGWSIYQIDAGVPTLVDAIGSSLSVSTEYTISITDAGSTCSVTIAGITLGPVTIGATYNTNTECGVAIGNGGGIDATYIDVANVI